MTIGTIRTQALAKKYQMGEVPVHALRGLDLEFVKGEFIAIMGPSGSGKSTLLHLLAGLEIPSEGTIEFGDQVISSLSDRELTLLRRRKIGIVFQFFNLLPNLTALENTALPLLLDGETMREAQRSASQILDWVGLGDREDHTIDQLSGGEQQRVALARALISQPDLLLADEPTGNLDHHAGEQVLALFRRAADQNGQTIIMVTHDPGAASYADRVIFLADGCVVSELHSEPLSVDLIARHQAALQT